jgi:hypothetical protein
MKTKLFLSAIIFIALTFQSFSQTPFALSAHGGYSWINGVVGGELQVGNFGVSGGWMPTKMPISGEKISSVGVAFSVYTGMPDETSYYASIGVASNGYREETMTNYGYSEEIVAPMTIAMVGVKSGNDFANFRLGGGYGWCEYGGAWTFEATLGFVLFSNLK